MAVFTILFTSVNAQEGAKKENSLIKDIYTCPMHADMVSNEAGKCAKCGMELNHLNLSVKEKAHWADMKLYSCPMHPEVRSNKPGHCNKCKSALKVETLAYSCPMHPNQKSDKAGKCSVCGMQMEKK